MRIVVLLLATAAALLLYAYAAGPQDGSNNAACERVLADGGGTGEGNPLYVLFAPRRAADPGRCDAAIVAAKRRWKLILAGTGLGAAGIMAVPFAFQRKTAQSDELPRARVV